MQRFSSLRSKGWLRYQCSFKRELHVNHYTPTLIKEHSNPVNALLEWNTRCNSKRHASLLSLNPAPGSTSVAAKDDIKEFISIYPDVVKDLTETCWTDDTSQYYEMMLTKVLPSNRTYGVGHSLATSYKTLVPMEKQTPEDIHMAHILGWCTELLCAALTTGDDVRDESKTRNTVLCWHRTEDVGMRAIVDAQMLENAIYLIIKKYLSTHQCYVPIMELFQDVTMQALMGQSMDEIYTMGNGKPFMDVFTVDRYQALVRFKTAYVNILPTRLAMYLANIENQKLHKDATAILLEIGHFWQVDNDVLEYFGEISAYGKNTTDIPKGKCTWLIVEALQRASAAQRTILEENFGRPVSDCEKAVENVYKDLDLFNLYISYKKQAFEEIRKDITGIHYKPLRKLLYKLCELPVGFEALSTT